MSERIAMGFHTCVDYELVWDTTVVEEQIKAFDIRADELRMDIEVDSERAIWIVWDTAPCCRRAVTMSMSDV